jgi:opacity protein-like surface antigen
MKAMNLLFAGICLMPALLISAQEHGLNEGKTILANPFEKGRSFFPLMRNFDYCYSNYYDEDDVKLGHQNRLDLDFEMNYFVIRNFAIGLDFCAGWSGDHYNYEELDRDWMARLLLTYGMPINNDFNFYLQGGLGYGMDKIISSSGTSSFTQKDDVWSYGATLGFPIRLGGNVYLTPKLSYSHLITDYDDGKTTDNHFRLGLGFETYLGCSDYMCDCKHGYSLSRGRYDQGSSYLGFYSRGSFGIGNSKTEFDNKKKKQESWTIIIICLITLRSAPDFIWAPA